MITQLTYTLAHQRRAERQRTGADLASGQGAAAGRAAHVAQQ
jgi:hypothetical protein